MRGEHTKGPWLWQDRDGWRNLVIKPGRGAIVDLARGRLVGTKEEKEANARLIAAAPDLLEALQKARNQVVAFMLDTHSPEAAVANVAYIDAALLRARAE